MTTDPNISEPSAGSSPDLHPESPETNLAALAQDIHGWAAELGFDALGVTDLDLTPHDTHLQRWLERRFHGDMGYMNRNVDKRIHPARLVPETVRVISARMNYLAQDTQPMATLGNEQLGYISRYALGRDYHKVLRRRLARLAQRIHAAAADHGPYRAFTDSAPVLEKAFGEKAGLGWMGKHSLLLDADAGSWFFVGEIFTSLPLPLDAIPAADQCGSCSACMTVCPTAAIIAPKIVDARRCISYLTIEHKGAIPVELRPLMGNRIYGCDDCQLWCPWNRSPQHTKETDFAVRHRLDRTPLTELFAWTEADFLKYTEGSAIRRVSYEQWSRNIAVALGNTTPPGSDAVLAALRARALDPSLLVQEHIAWALARLTRAE